MSHQITSHVILCRDVVHRTNITCRADRSMVQHNHNISHGARIKRIVSLICRVSSMSRHITSHLIACRSAARRTTAVCRAVRCMWHRITSHRIASHVAAERMSANPCGGLQQGVVHQCWDERTLAGVAECTLAGVTGTSEPLRGLRSVPLRGQLRQLSETAATVAELWEGSLESCELE